MTGHATCCCRATLDTIDHLRGDLARVTEELDRAWGFLVYSLRLAPRQADQDQLDLANGDRQ